MIFRVIMALKNLIYLIIQAISQRSVLLSPDLSLTLLLYIHTCFIQPLTATHGFLRVIVAYRLLVNSSSPLSFSLSIGYDAVDDVTNHAVSIFQEVPGDI